MNDSDEKDFRWQQRHRPKDLQSLAQEMRLSFLPGFFSTAASRAHHCIPTGRSSSDGADRILPSGPSVFDWVHGDVLCHMFSFLGYKRLVRLRYVSHTWRAAIDSSDADEVLWKAHYARRFGIVQDDDEGIRALSSGSDTSCWRSIFMEKYALEQAARRQAKESGSSNTRPWVCNYVNCRRILSSAKISARHLAMHQLQQKRKRQRSRSSNARKKRERQSAKRSKTRA